MRTLYLFPDTNLFIQCRRLGDLDWSVWSKFDEIQLIVCKPIQREIDNLKRRGNNRVGRRARKTHSMFRKILVDGREFELVREENPRVKICIDPTLTPDLKIKDQLDYNDIDDQLVGCVHSFRERFPNRDVRLLTHDAGPMASAKMLELQFVPILDDWLLPPENSKIERKNQRLQEELAKVKRGEPQFEIIFVDDDQIEIGSLDFELFEFQPLTENEIAELIGSIKVAIPNANENGLSENTVRFFKNLLSISTRNSDVGMSMTNHEISEHIDKEYPKWINRCEYMLRHLHFMLESESRPTTFSLSARNVGTRPGKDILLTFVAEGNFKICPPQNAHISNNSMEQANSEKFPSISPPPATLKGKLDKRNMVALDSRLTNFPFNGSQTELFRGNEPLGPLRPNFSNHQFEPNKFYYTQQCSSIPAETFSLECKQWRHGGNAKVFCGELCFDQDSREIGGILKCSIEAENFSTPVNQSILVKGKKTVTNIRNFANSLLEDLLLLVDK